MGYTMPHKRSRLIFRRKTVFEDAAIVEMRVWQVPKSARTPEGFKYSLVYVGSRGERVLGYDNAEGKGHHRHFRGLENAERFHSMSALVARFLVEVGELRGAQE